MTNILHYPHYTPSRADLRRFLLLYDTVATIVPYPDQYITGRREHVLELSELTDDELVRFCDPQSYALGWFNAPDVIKYLEELLSDQKFASKIQSARDDIWPSQQLLDHSPRTVFKLERLKQNGWSALAMEKLSGDVKNFLYQHNLGYPMPQTIRETNPILVPDEVYSTVISRLAREICDVEGLYPLAHNRFDAVQFLRESPLARHQMRSELIAVSLEIAVPSRIGQFSPENYMALRENMADTRRQINVIADNLLVGLNLDSTADVNQFREQLADSVSDINERVEQARKHGRWKAKKSTIIDFMVSATGGVVGAAVGGIPGALGGAAVGTVASKLGHKLSTRSSYDDLMGIKQLALIRDRVLNAPLADPQRSMAYII